MDEKNSTNPNIGQIINERDENKQKELYNKYVENMTPVTNKWLNCLKAFFVGGGICLIGEIINSIYKNMGNDEELTGLNVYQKLGQFAGAGSIVPITGFANSVGASAIEYQAEGQVFGVGCKIFTIAGPVILYGIFSSWILGVIYWLCGVFGWI